MQQKSRLGYFGLLVFFKKFFLYIYKISGKAECGAHQCVRLHTNFISVCAEFYLKPPFGQDLHQILNSKPL